MVHHLTKTSCCSPPGLHLFPGHCHFPALGHGSFGPNYPRFCQPCSGGARKYDPSSHFRAIVAYIQAVIYPYAHLLIVSSNRCSVHRHRCSSLPSTPQVQSLCRPRLRTKSLQMSTMRTRPMPDRPPTTSMNSLPAKLSPSIPRRSCGLSCCQLVSSWKATTWC